MFKTRISILVLDNSIKPTFVGWDRLPGNPEAIQHNRGPELLLGHFFFSNVYKHYVVYNASVRGAVLHEDVNV